MDGKENGLGTSSWTNGDKYIGEFKDEIMHGQGTWIYADGDKYVGEFKDDMMHGQGIYTEANGTVHIVLCEEGQISIEATSRCHSTLQQTSFLLNHHRRCGSGFGSLCD